MEALIHLHSTSADCIEQAQTALASARSFQLDKQVQEVPQIGMLLHLIDLSCSLHCLDIPQAVKKADEIRLLLEDVLKDSIWREDGVLEIPASTQPIQTSTQPSDDLTGSEQPGNSLTFHWLAKQEVYALGYLLNAITLSPRNAQDGRKGEKYLQEGLRITKGTTLLSLKIKSS
jgi:hypothetical protein